ncbi:MAG: hypothetical protein ACO4AU_10910 [bacterium]
MRDKAHHLVAPEPAGPGNRFTLAQVQAWREQGFVLIREFFTPAEVQAVRQAVKPLLPPDPEAVTDFGSMGAFEFPSGLEPLDDLTLHPDLLHAVAQLLEVEVGALRLSQSDLWAKFGRRLQQGGIRDNSDQRIHMDYPNHYLTHPPVWEAPEAVEMIVYYDHHSECGGETALVSRVGREDPAYVYPYTQMPGVGALPWTNDRESTEALLAQEHPEVARFRERLYARERYAAFEPGTVLFYRHDLWHRGTPLQPGALRLVQNLTFRKAECEWISTVQSGWAWKMYRPDLSTERLIARITPEQRTVLGFPAPGSSYWTPQRLEAATARFGPLGFDATPYRQALSPS